MTVKVRYLLQSESVLQFLPIPCTLVFTACDEWPMHTQHERSASHTAAETRCRSTTINHSIIWLLLLLLPIAYSDLGSPVPGVVLRQRINTCSL